MKYVALLAFTKIVTSHPQLVGLHQDVIVECIDDPDISIRTRALELVTGMVDPNNLMSIVERLLRQLKEAAPESAADNPGNDRGLHSGVVPSGDEDDEQAAESLRKNQNRSSDSPPLPEDYRTSVIERILEMCSRETYTNVTDFEWYIGVLVDLVRHCPSKSSDKDDEKFGGVAHTIGSELRNVAVRVKSVRPEAVAAAQSLLLIERRQDLFPPSGSAALVVLESAAWIAGEYPDLLPDPQALLTSLTHPTSAQLPASVLTIYVQAVPKVFVRLTSSQQQSWSSSRKSQTTLLMARIIHFLEPLVQHPNLEVQERAVEYIELMRVSSEAVSSHPTESDQGFVDAPLLITQAIPSLFMGMELNPVSMGALSKVPLTEGLDLDTPINDNLQSLLQRADFDDDAFADDDEVTKFYFERPSALPVQAIAAADRLEVKESRSSSYQEDRSLSAEAIAKKKAERASRYRDDPFYIDSEKTSGASTPLHNILKSSDGEELDIDAIPVMDLQLDSKETVAEQDRSRQSKPSRKSRRRVEIAAEETIGDDNDVANLASTPPTRPSFLSRPKKSLLEVDSSGLSRLSLSEQDDATNTGNSRLDMERRQAEEEEMARAMKEVERVRLEMQRAQERIEAKHIPEEGTLVKRKKKKKPRVQGDNEEQATSPPAADQGDGAVVKKKKKKKVKAEDENGVPATNGGAEPVETAAAAAKPKKKKRRQVAFDNDDAE